MGNVLFPGQLPPNQRGRLTSQGPVYGGTMIPGSSDPGQFLSPRQGSPYFDIHTGRMSNDPAPILYGGGGNGTPNSGTPNPIRTQAYDQVNNPGTQAVSRAAGNKAFDWLKGVFGGGGGSAHGWYDAPATGSGWGAKPSKRYPVAYQDGVAGYYPDTGFGTGPWTPIPTGSQDGGSSTKSPAMHPPLPPGQSGLKPQPVNITNPGLGSNPTASPGNSPYGPPPAYPIPGRDNPNPFPTTVPPVQQVSPPLFHGGPVMSGQGKIADPTFTQNPVNPGYYNLGNSSNPTPQTGTNPANPFSPFDPSSFQLPSYSKNIIPQSLGNDFFSALQGDLARQEQSAAENLLGFQESRGLLNSGETNKALIEQVLGPSLQRQQEALLPLAMQSAQQTQQQQYGSGLQELLGQQQASNIAQQGGIQGSLQQLSGEQQLAGINQNIYGQEALNQQQGGLNEYAQKQQYGRQINLNYQNFQDQLYLLQQQAQIQKELDQLAHDLNVNYHQQTNDPSKLFWSNLGASGGDALGGSLGQTGGNVVRGEFNKASGGLGG